MSRRKKPRYIPFAGGVIDETSKDKPKDDKKDDLKKKEKEKKISKKDKKKETKKDKKIDTKKQKKKELKRIEEKVEDKTQDISTFTWQMDKFQIMLADGEDIMVAIMLESEPSDPIKTSLIEFTRQFETMFKEDIKNFAGKVSVFQPARELASNLFNLFLMQPQMLPQDEMVIKEARLNSVERRVLYAAQNLAEERGFFFIATLMEHFVKEKKMDEEKLIKSIFSLHDKKIFRSIPIESISEESEKYSLIKRLPPSCKLNIEEKNRIIDELINSTEESREHFFNVLPNLPKKNLTEAIFREIEKRRKIRENRDQLFSKIDEYINNDQYDNAVIILNQVANLSLQIGEKMVAKEFQERAQMFQQAAAQMKQRIPLLKQERNQLLTNAEAFEVEGQYDNAIANYQRAAEISHEISDFDLAKKCEQAIERLRSLKELAKLRESLR
ncbi:MAG: hypothetical protein ACTSVY_04035 [Candidatus Helarchaeota archaeon]